METPYGGLWYAAGNPGGFRFGAVNRPSPPRANYMNVKSKRNGTASKLVGQVAKDKTGNEIAIRTDKPSSLFSCPDRFIFVW